MQVPSPGSAGVHCGKEMLGEQYLETCPDAGIPVGEEDSMA